MVARNEALKLRDEGWSARLRREGMPPIQNAAPDRSRFGPSTELTPKKLPFRYRPAVRDALARLDEYHERQLLSSVPDLNAKIIEAHDEKLAAIRALVPDKKRLDEVIQLVGEAINDAVEQYLIGNINEHLSANEEAEVIGHVIDSFEQAAAEVKLAFSADDPFFTLPEDERVELIIKSWLRPLITFNYFSQHEARVWMRLAHGVFKADKESDDGDFMAFAHEFLEYHYPMRELQKLVNRLKERAEEAGLSIKLTRWDEHPTPAAISIWRGLHEECFSPTTFRDFRENLARKQKENIEVLAERFGKGGELLAFARYVFLPGIWVEGAQLLKDIRIRPDNLESATNRIWGISSG